MSVTHGWCIALALLFAAGNAEAQAVRGLNSDVLRAAITAGSARSATFTGLVEAVAKRKGVVLVEWTATPTGTDAALAHVVTTGADGTRFLRVLVRPGARNGDRLVATLGHELQHAVEILDNPDVASVAFHSAHRVWETKAAQRVQQTILDELKRR